MAIANPQLEEAEEQARRQRAFEERVASVAGVRNAADAALVGLTAEALAEGFWQGWRLHSPAQWVMWRAGVTRSTAGRVVALARRAEELPVTMAAFTEGRLSIDQAATVARYTPARFDATVCELAVNATVNQIVKATRKYDFDAQAKLADGPEPGDDEPTPDPPPPEADRSVWFGSDDDGSWWARMNLPADEGMAFEAALKAVRDRLHDQARDAAKARAAEDGTPASEITVPHVSWADATVGMAQAVITGGAAGAEVAARARVLMHLEIPRTYGLADCTCTCDRGRDGCGDGHADGDRGGAAVPTAGRRVRRPSRRTGATIDRRCGDPRRALRPGPDPTTGALGLPTEHCDEGGIDPTCCAATELFAGGQRPAPGSTGTTAASQGTTPPTDQGQTSAATDASDGSDGAAAPPEAPTADPDCECACHRPGWMGSLHLGGVLPDELRRYLACDADVEVVWEKGTTPVNLGRTQHIVPRRIRRLIEHRDRGCRVPGCDQTWWLQVHHIQHWEDDGETVTWNLICLCSRHHRLHHQGLLGIAGNADEPKGVTFTDQYGRPMDGGAPARPPAPTDMPQVKPYVCPVGERLDPDAVYFTPSPKPAPSKIDNDHDPGDTDHPAPVTGPHTCRHRTPNSGTGRPDTGPPDGSRAPPTA